MICRPDWLVLLWLSVVVSSALLVTRCHADHFTGRRSNPFQARESLPTDRVLSTSDPFTSPLKKENEEGSSREYISMDKECQEDDKPTRKWQEYCKMRNTSHSFQPSPAPTTAASPQEDANEATSLTTAEAAQSPKRTLSFDSLDQHIWRLGVPILLHYAIAPAVAAWDLYILNQKESALAVAGAAAAQQVFHSILWLTSFLPSLTAPRIARADCDEHVQRAVTEALLLSFCFAIVSTAIMLLHTESLLSMVLPATNAPARTFARPVLRWQALATGPSLLTLIGMAAFRGRQDTVTPVIIHAVAHLVHIVVVPVLVLKTRLGVSGVAVAAVVTQVVSAVAYAILLQRHKLVSWHYFLVLPNLTPLFRNGLVLQLRNVALNISFLIVARTTQIMDTTTGVTAAAHALAMQLFSIGGAVLLALSGVAQVAIPKAMSTSLERARWTSRRLLRWGLTMGCLLAVGQVLLLPIFLKSSPLPAVREAALVPALIGSVFQILNGFLFVGEGVMIGTGSFGTVSLATILAMVGLLGALQVFPVRFGLTGVWMGLAVFNTLRLSGVVVHQWINGPLVVLAKEQEEQ